MTTARRRPPFRSLLVSMALALGACQPSPSGGAPKIAAIPADLPGASGETVQDRLYHRAVASIEARDYGEALDALFLALDAAPADARVLNALGVVYDKLGRFDLSDRYYRLAERADPGSAVVASNRNYSLMLQQGEALQAAAAVSVETRDRLAPAGLVGAPAAMAAAAPDPPPQPPAPTKASQAARQPIATAPPPPQANAGPPPQTYVTIAPVLASGARREAPVTVEKPQPPHGLVARVLIALGLVPADRPAAPLATLVQRAPRQLAAREPARTPPPARRAVGQDVDQLYRAAVTAIENRGYVQALTSLQEARQLAPGDPRVLTALGVVYDQMGRFDLSGRCYDLAEAADPHSVIVAIDRRYSRRLQAHGGAAIPAQVLMPKDGSTTPLQVADASRPRRRA